MEPLFDMHCHLDFAPNARDAAARLDALGAGAFCALVEPSDYAGFAASMQQWPSVRVGAGLHPWWIENERAEEQTELLCSVAQQTRFVGEVGLDFSPRYEASRELQLNAFRTVSCTCAMLGSKVLTIHAVRSASAVLDILQESGALDSCACILHWFSGSSDELARGVRLGCLFSFGQASLATKRGHEYARVVPPEQLLLETDYPAQGRPYDVDAMQQQLASTLHQIASLRKTDPEDLATRVSETSRHLLALP